MKEENKLFKRKFKIVEPDFFKCVFGNHEKERIFISIKSLILEDHCSIKLEEFDDSD